MKRSAFLIAMLLLSVVLCAAPRSVQEAMAEAAQFMSDDSVMRVSPRGGQLQLAHVLRQTPSSDDLAYVFNRGRDGGFVIVSADDRVKTILGYADEGSFDATQLPTNMQAWLQHYAEEIAYAAQIKYLPGRYGKQQSQYVVASPQVSAISPLLGNIKWNQDMPYNKLCPRDGDNTRCYTGCVATAMAQVMCYWQHPATGTGSHSYTWTNCNGQDQVLSANFGATTYDWDNMRAVYNSGGYTTVEETAVATLMYHVGVACEMGYGGETAGGSGTSSSAAAHALYTYFGYDAGLSALRPDYIGESAFEAGVLAELQANRPVLLSGYTENYEGHAFVCDGVNSQGLFHINWGWGGYQNGYFALSALDPDDQGIGGAASGNGFHLMVMAIVGIQPDQGTPQADYLELGARELSLTTDMRVAKTRQVRVDMTEVMNLAFEEYYGKVGMVIADSQYNIVRWFDYDIFSQGDGFVPSSYFDSYYRSTLSDLTPGDYMLVPAFSNREMTSVYRMSIAGELKELPFTVTTDSVIFTFASGEPEPVTDHWLFSEADVKYYPNYGNNLYLQLRTSDVQVNSESQVTKGCAIVFDLYTEDASSIVGTYMLDRQSTGNAGTFGYDDSGLYIPAGSYYLSGGMVTITLDEQGNYRFAYAVNVGNAFFGDTVVIAPSNVLVEKVISNSRRDPYTLTNKHATALPASEARQLSLELPQGNRSYVPCLVRGVVSSFNNTPAQIAQYGSAQYYISDDGTTADQLYCFRSYWLNNVPFTTGYELNMGDTVVVYAPLMNYQGIPELYYSYIYQSSAYGNFDSALEDVEAADGRKWMHNGVLYIRREDGIYDVLGHKIQ